MKEAQCVSQGSNKSEKAKKLMKMSVHSVRRVRRSQGGQIQGTEASRIGTTEFSVSSSAMLDYSDEDSELWSVRKRNPSPSRAEDPGARPGFLEGKDEGSPLGFTTKAQSIYKEFKRGSCKMVLPTPDPPSAEAFIISEFIPPNPFKPNNIFRNRGLGFKGDKLFSDQSDNFSPDGEDHPDSFYKSTKTLVLFAQVFAAFPVSGFRGPNYKSLSFKWIHYKTAYWGLTFIGSVFCFVSYVASGLKDGAFEAASGIVFSASGILSSLLLLALSRNWRNLSKEFADVELRLRKYGYPKKIGVKFKILTIVVLLVALVEHVASKIKNLELVLLCSQKNNGSIGLVKPFFLSEYSEAFALSSYSLWKGILVMSAHFLVTANWNLKDLFLCLISWTIVERFKQVNDLLNKVHGQDKPISFWKEVREDFNSLSVLTKRTDAYIRKLMLLSMGNNLFFICIQLFHSLNKKLDTFKLIYFFWSFGYLVLRTGCVAFSAATINDESKEPKTVLYSVPQKNYTAEVRRFLTQLTTNEIALTGSGFFSITRSLILTITGSVITYEIVLVQFGTKDTEENAQGNLTFCLEK